MFRALVIAALLMASSSPVWAAQSNIDIKATITRCGSTPGIEGIRQGCLDDGIQACCEWLVSLTGS